MKQRAHEVLHWRNEQQKIAKMEADAAIIQEKAEQHQQEYSRRRQEMLEKGMRKNAMYRRERTKEVIESHTGPELALVLKGIHRYKSAIAEQYVKIPEKISSYISPYIELRNQLLL